MGEKGFEGLGCTSRSWLMLKHIHVFRFINAFHWGNNIFKAHWAYFQEGVWAHPVLNESSYRIAWLGIISLAFSSVWKHRTERWAFFFLIPRWTNVGPLVFIKVTPDDVSFESPSRPNPFSWCQWRKWTARVSLHWLCALGTLKLNSRPSCPPIC